jgi:hypothetical protein
MCYRCRKDVQNGVQNRLTSLRRRKLAARGFNRSKSSRAKRHLRAALGAGVAKNLIAGKIGRLRAGWKRVKPLNLTKRASLLHNFCLVSLSEEPLLYLIDVNHAVQFKSAVAQAFGESERVREKREAFRAHVAEMIDKLGIEILSEEFSEEGKGQPDEQEVEAFKKNYPVELATALEGFSWEAVLEQLRKAKGIKHRFCDPDSKERKARGIEDPDSERGRAQREQVWLSRIADCKDKRVLFVCGDDHYDAFAQLLATNGFNVRRGPHYDISNEEFHDSERTSPDV